MCGIFGYFCRSLVSMQKIVDLLQILERHQFSGEKNPVGGHGAGICFLDETGRMIVHKVGKTNSSPAEDPLFIKKISNVNSRIILGHVRYASNEFMHTVKHPEATQPYMVNCLGLSEIISAHNGKVRNYEEIRKGLSKEHYFQSETMTLVDSEVIPHLLEENLFMCSDESTAVRRTFNALEGNNTVVLLTELEGTYRLHVLHKGHTRGMHIWRNNIGEIVLCSRMEPVQQIFGKLLKENDFGKILTIEWKEDREEHLTHEIVGL